MEKQEAVCSDRFRKDLGAHTPSSLTVGVSVFGKTLLSAGFSHTKETKTENSTLASK